jgi:putative oxidoreductase
MLSNSQRTFIQTKGVVVGRVLIGLLFLVSGIGMFMADGGPAASAGFYTKLGIPMAGTLVWLVAILKVVAGGLVVAGKHVGAASAALIIFTIGTILTAHRELGDTQQLKNLSIIGGLLYVIAFGPGQCNVKDTK